jgi:hypothetical protein
MPDGVLLMAYQNNATGEACPKTYPIKYLASGLKILRHRHPQVNKQFTGFKCYFEIVKPRQLVICILNDLNRSWKKVWENIIR